MPLARHPVDDRAGSTRRSARLVITGMMATAVVSLGFDGLPREREHEPRPGEDMVLALPVPPDARVLVRRIDHAGRRSLLVVDMDPTDPPDFEDTAVFLRLEPFPDVILARSTRADWRPDPDHGVSWWTFPHSGDVKVSSHPTMVEAASAFRESQGSGNPGCGSKTTRIMRVHTGTTGGESGGTTRVGIDIDR